MACIEKKLNDTVRNSMLERIHKTGFSSLSHVRGVCCSHIFRSPRIECLHPCYTIAKCST